MATYGDDFYKVAISLTAFTVIDADTNTAFSILLRYQDSISQHSSQTFVEDALYLRKNLNLEGGRFIITKYSKRSPPPFARAQSRPSTPQNNSFRSPQRTQSPLASPAKIYPSPSSLEAMLQDAARGLYAKSEGWGIGKAVFDAVSEVKRNVPTLQSTRSPPRGRAESFFPADDSADELLRRIGYLEGRNKALAAMLGDAVAELWKCDSAQVDDAKVAGSEDVEKQRLSAAIAKVQFVQVFLEDPSIQLPAEDSKVAKRRSEGSPEPVKAPEQRAANNDAEATARLAATANQEPSDTAGRKGSVTHIPINASHTPSFRHSRPSLAQSSFSWMLEGDNRPGSFMSSTPPPSSEKRKGRGGKGFLFGEESAEGGVRKDSVGEVENEEIGLGDIKR